MREKKKGWWEREGMKTKSDPIIINEMEKLYMNMMPPFHKGGKVFLGGLIWSLFICFQLSIYFCGVHMPMPYLSWKLVCESNYNNYYLGWEKKVDKIVWWTHFHGITCLVQKDYKREGKAQEWHGPRYLRLSFLLFPKNMPFGPTTLVTFQFVTICVFFLMDLN